MEDVVGVHDEEHSRGIVQGTERVSVAGPEFDQDRVAVIERARSAGLGAIVVNGLEPKSNRTILAMAEKAREFAKPNATQLAADAILSQLNP